MKSKLFFGTVIILNMVLLSTVIFLGSRVNYLNTSIDTMIVKSNNEESYKVHTLDNGAYLAVEDFENYKSALEERMANNQVESPTMDIEQFLNTAIRDIERTSDLLNRINSIETKYGMITGVINVADLTIAIREYSIDESGSYMDSGIESIINLDDGFIPYFVATNGLVKGTVDDLIHKVDMDLTNDFNDVYTFKIVGDKAVHIYQGYWN